MQHYFNIDARTTPENTKSGTTSEQFGSKGNRITTEDGLPTLRPCPVSDLFELLQCDNEVHVMDHIAMFLTRGRQQTRGVEPAIARWQGAPAAWPRNIPSSAGQVCGHRIFTNRPQSTGIALVVARLGHWQVDKGTVNAGKRVNGTIALLYFLVKQGCAISMERGKAARRAAARLPSPLLKVWLEGLNVPPSPLQILKSPTRKPIPSVCVGQRAAAARNH